MTGCEPIPHTRSRKLPELQQAPVPARSAHDSSLLALDFERVARELHLGRKNDCRSPLLFRGRVTQAPGLSRGLGCRLAEQFQLARRRS
jgi:hypothetical protein